MRPQIGMILHYLPLDADGKPTTPKPALVMGLDEHNPPNLDLHVFRPPNEGAGTEYMTRVPPAGTTVTGSGWAPAIVAPLSTAEMRELVDNMRPGTVSKGSGALAEMAQGRAALAEGAPPPADGDEDAERSRKVEADFQKAREGQEGSVILLALGSVLLAGVLSTALGL